MKFIEIKNILSYVCSKLSHRCNDNIWFKVNCSQKVFLCFFLTNYQQEKTHSSPKKYGRAFLYLPDFFKEEKKHPGSEAEAAKELDYLSPQAARPLDTYTGHNIFMEKGPYKDYSLA